jgi:hypothetical protein
VYYNLEEVVLFNLGASRSFDPPSSFHILGRVLMAMQDDDDEEGSGLAFPFGVLGATLVPAAPSSGRFWSLLCGKDPPGSSSSPTSWGASRTSARFDTLKGCYRPGSRTRARTIAILSSFSSSFWQCRRPDHNFISSISEKLGKDPV